VEVKFIDLPQEMQRAMARQAEAEREKRAKIIHAEGELQASEKLAQAAAIIASEPVTIQLRYLQTLTRSGRRRTPLSFSPAIDFLQAFSGLKSRVKMAADDWLVTASGSNSGPFRVCRGDTAKRDRRRRDEGRPGCGMALTQIWRDSMSDGTRSAS